MTLEEHSSDIISLTINDENVGIPKELLSNEVVFQSIFTEETWSQLDSKDKSRLKEYLPTFPNDSSQQQNETLMELFGGSTSFKFGNPISTLYDKIMGGHLFDEIVKEKEKCHRAKRKSYKLMRKEYFKKIVQEILVSRQRILDKANRHGGGFVGPIRTHCALSKVSLDEKVKKKYQRILRDIKQECQDVTASSDEEDSITTDKDIPLPFPPPYFGMHQFMRSGPTGKSHPLSFYGQPPYMGVSGGNPYPYFAPSGRSWDGGAQSGGLSDGEYRSMLETHRKRRICSENHPELDTSDTTLADIITRANPAKKGKAPKKAKTSCKEDEKPLKNKKRVRVKPKEPTPFKVSDKINESVVIKEENDFVRQPSKPSSPIPMRNESNITSAQTPAESENKFKCFFSLLRVILKEAPCCTCTFDQVRQRVHTFQRNDGHQVEWARQSVDWSDLVSSALKYLAGDGRATIIQDFVPMATLTENAKEYKWTGSGYDDDDILVPLCAHWLDTVNRTEDSDSAFSDSGDNVHASREHMLFSRGIPDQQDFVEQEKKRYENPHKPYTYCLNGALSVVGAVKGVFHKESGFSKAREHALLISNRPAYVTILSLVKDAVARLPNGEGTRAEVCRLLKDSQFINPEASDAQIHTVVSGALDRLHAERDPCVKYDITRKVWIYLHRNRTEGEFERIHQASAAAALAKKQYAQRQKTVKQKKALQDLVDQQDKSLKDLPSEAKVEATTPKKSSKRPKSSSHGESGSKSEKSKAVPNKDQSKTPNKEHARTPNREQGKTPNREQGKTPNREQGKTLVRDQGKTLVREPGKTPGREHGKTPNKEQGKMSHKEQGDKSSPQAHSKISKVASGTGPVKKEVKSSQSQRTESVHSRPIDRAEIAGMLSRPIESTVKAKATVAPSPLAPFGKARDTVFAPNLKLPLCAAKSAVLTQQVEARQDRSRELLKAKEKPKEEGAMFSTITLDASSVKLLPDCSTDKEVSLPSSGGSGASAHIAIRPTNTPVNPVLNIVPPHCTGTKFVRLPFSHATTIASALPAQQHAKGHTVKYSTVHLPNPNSSVLITVPQHVDRVAPLRISLPRASIGANINVARGIQSQNPVEFPRTARPGVILSRMAAPLGTHQRIYVRQISHESLQGQAKPPNPVVTTAK